MILLFYSERKDLKKRFLTVNSGGHGKKDGSYPGTQNAADLKFLAQDIMLCKEIDGFFCPHAVNAMSCPIRDGDKDSCDAWCNSLVYWQKNESKLYDIYNNVLSKVIEEHCLKYQLGFKQQPKLIYRHSETDGKWESWIAKCKDVPNTIGIFKVEVQENDFRYFGAFTTIPWGYGGEI